MHMVIDYYRRCCMIQVKQGTDDHPIIQYAHGLYHELGVHDLTVQTEYA